MVTTQDIPIQTLKRESMNCCGEDERCVNEPRAKRKEKIDLSHEEGFVSRISTNSECPAALNFRESRRKCEDRILELFFL